MGVVVTGRYTGGRTVELLHEPSGATIVTDAPRESGGDGAGFSPLNLVVAGLGSCMLTTIAVVAFRSGISVDGMHMRAEEIKAADGIRIAEFVVALHLPTTLEVFDRQKLERAALGCPVHKSLHPEIPVRSQFVYDVG